MTELRDARLRRALDEAPDAQLQPPPRVKDAVLAAARAAVAPPVPWWKKWLGSGSSSRGARVPWNAAFATFLLAGFVGLLWQGEEPPGARLDESKRAPRVEAPRPAPAQAPEGAASTAVAQAAPEVVAKVRPVDLAPPSNSTRERRLEQKRDEKAVAPSPLPDSNVRGALPSVAAAPPMPQPAESPRADALAKKAEEAPQALGATVPAREAAAAAGPSAPQAPAPATAPPAAAEGRAAAQTPAAASPAPAFTRRPAAATTSPWSGWESARIESGGRQAIVASSQAGRLAAAIDRLLRTDVSAGVADESLDLQITLARGPETLGTLLVGRTQARWFPGDRGAPRTYLHGAEAVGALQKEADAWLAGR